MNVKKPKTRITRSRSALCEALLHLLEEKPLDQITVREIAARADVGYATFFRHYPDKEALLHDLAADEIRRLLTMTLPLFFAADTLASTRALCSYVWEHRALWRSLLGGGASAALKEEYLVQALELLENHKGGEAWLPDDLAVTFAVSSLVEILGWWLMQTKPMPVTEMAEIVNRLTVQPIMGELRVSAD